MMSPTHSESDASACTNVSAPSSHAAESKECQRHRGAWVGQAATIPKNETESRGSSTIKASDIENIFRASTTTGFVTPEQLERIEEMHERISGAVDFDFNYTCLLIIASIIAGIGLIADSGTIVVSSMLLSPLMGPVVGMAYGVIVWDISLVRRSFRNECISLLICIILGMAVCVTTGWTELSYQWPTEQMSSRGEVTNLLIGLPVAFLSGLGVALSVLDEQTSSLVGVAVSASLLPPAVNAGLCWIYSVALQTDVITDKDIDALRQHQFAQMGGVSLALTVANIALVAISGMLMFRIKEVLPVKKKIFWDDLKTARRINQKRALMAEVEGDN